MQVEVAVVEVVAEIVAVGLIVVGVPLPVAFALPIPLERLSVA